MKNNNLPIVDLQKYGIINEDQTFNEKLKPEDIEKFLNGYTIVADHEESRATFQLINDQKSLKVILLERDRNLTEVLKTSMMQIQYSEIKNVVIEKDDLSYDKKVFVFDAATKTVIEYDLLKNISELTQILALKNETEETVPYRAELLKLKGFLQDKIDKYPGLAKQITEDLNIISKEINVVDGFSSSRKREEKYDQTKIELNVNDPDLYQQAAILIEKNELDKDDIEIIKGHKR